VHAAGILWPDADEHHASANLRSTLWRISGISPPLVSREPSLRLTPGITVDLWDAYAMASRSVDPTTPMSDLGPDPTAWFVEDLLPDWNEDWVMVERERFRQVRLHVLEGLCDRFAKAGLMMQAIEAGLAAVNADPLRETSHRALIRAHMMEGNWSEAVRQYLRCRMIFDEELGIEPSAGLTEMLGRGRLKYVRTEQQLSGTRTDLSFTVASLDP
jgi:DNA-binding SARP family transcriptional activator